MTDEEQKIEEPKPKEKPQPPDKGKAKAPDEELSKLQQDLESVQKEREELFGRLQRVSADYANFQKRVPKQVSDSVGYEKDKIIRSLLPILDNMDHLLKAHSTESTDAMVQGVEIIYGHMLEILKSHGIEQMSALGEPFDPARHEAVMRRMEPGRPANIVLEEVQKGYRIGDRLLRPTRVVVSQAPAQSQDQEPNGKTSKEGQEVE
jgi:molecular chaperone GrpE